MRCMGKLIRSYRVKKQMTVQDVAAALGVNERLVTKWETGRAMPDSSIMLDLCNELKISVNELLNGEMIDMKDYNENAEKNLLDMVKQKEENDKKLLRMEILMGILCVLPILILTVIVSIIPLEEWIEGVIIGTSLIPLLIATPFALRIEQTAGYYECRKCNYKYIPTYKSVFVAMHVNRTRYMKCPKCKKYSWNKKILGGNEND